MSFAPARGPIESREFRGPPERNGPFVYARAIKYRRGIIDTFRGLPRTGKSRVGEGFSGENGSFIRRFRAGHVGTIYVAFCCTMKMRTFFEEIFISDREESGECFYFRGALGEVLVIRLGMFFEVRL